jgi:hypothetical protein
MVLQLLMIAVYVMVEMLIKIVLEYAMEVLL